MIRHRGSKRRNDLATRFATAALAAFALLAFIGLAEARSLALVIGNNAYVNVTQLKTAVGDARAVGDQLEKMGFIVRRSYDVDRRAMSRTLAAFDAELQPGDRALFFYSGHGFEISGANYLLPVDVPAAQIEPAGAPARRLLRGRERDRRRARARRAPDRARPRRLPRQSVRAAGTRRRPAREASRASMRPRASSS